MDTALTVTFAAEEARDILDRAPGTGWTVVHDEHVESRRWVSVHELVIEHNGLFFRAFYERGLTEMQEREPWEDQDTVTFERVEKRVKQVEVTEYVSVTS